MCCDYHGTDIKIINKLIDSVKNKGIKMKVRITMEIEKELTPEEINEFEQGKMNNMMPDQFYSILYKSELQSITKPNGFKVNSCNANFLPTDKT